MGISYMKLGTKELLRVIPTTRYIVLDLYDNLNDLKVEYDDNGGHDNPQFMKHASLLLWNIQHVESWIYRYLDNGHMTMNHGLEWGTLFLDNAMIVERWDEFFVFSIPMISRHDLFWS